MRVTLEQAIERLKSGVVAIPTETVYGLAASLSKPLSIDSIFVLKGRPRKNPLIIHLATAKLLADYVEEFPPDFDKISSFWPGPLTLVLPVNPAKVPASVRADLPTAAFRVPSLELTRLLLVETGPLVVPSANLSGRPSSTEAAHVEQDFGLDFPVLDGGSCDKGLESTILAFKEGKWRILRQGALSAEDLKEKLDYLPEIVKAVDPHQPECPGQLYRHYAPHATLSVEGPAEVILGFKEREYSLPLFPLGSLDNAEEVAHNLYDVLRELDEKEIKSAQVDLDFPDTGLWSTIRERLQKAMQK